MLSNGFVIFSVIVITLGQKNKIVGITTNYHYLKNFSVVTYL